ncbi:Chromatin modification-related protein YNG2 [Trametes pubescens]|uniref:Chromatin modification-related protein n=1 Tax=Trametes pubescens TaxID=154538 RepID=A0A1M2VCS9_TRAPU|nr:Chromatin modification-related protein YNG2 [Trametes pubescens]
MNANLEEAANIATEYLSKLTEEIRKETQKYFRHSSKNAGQALPNKDAAIPDTVDNLYAEVDALAAEKSALSQRLVRTLERAMARLNHDIQRILKLQGDDPGLPATQHFLSSVDSTVQQIQTNLRTAAAAVEPPSASISAAAPPPQKKRRLGATASGSTMNIKLPSPVPVSSGAYAGSSAQKSSLSRQVNHRHSPMRSRRTHNTTGGPDEDDAEGDEDMDEAGEDGADAEDQELYCYCQKLSYGEMIACDNDGCRYQWFHLSCVNLKPPLPENWYCEECSVKLRIGGVLTAAPAATTSSTTGGGRKGRKKQ